MYAGLCEDLCLLGIVQAWELLRCNYLSAAVCGGFQERNQLFKTHEDTLRRLNPCEHPVWNGLQSAGVCS